MSNTNQSNISIVDNDEIDFESITTDETHASNSTSISLEESTARSQLVVDERLNASNAQAINDLTVHPTPSRRLSIPNVVYNTSIGQSRIWTEESVWDYVFAANRDGQSNSRVQVPSDAIQDLLVDVLTPHAIQLIFNLLLIILPYGTQDTEPHTLIVPAHMIADQMEVYNENGDINEDGTLYENIDENINSSTTSADYAEQMIINESNGTETMDEPNNIENAMTSTDDHSSNIEHQQDTGDANTQEIVQHNERGQASPGVDNNQSHENVPTTSISITGSSETAQEIEQTLAGPTDNENHARSDASDVSAAGLDESQLNAQNRKQTNALNICTNIDETQR